jgi:hypothetical protein
MESAGVSVEWETCQALALGYATSDSSAFACGCWQLQSWVREKNGTSFDSGPAFLCRDRLYATSPTLRGNKKHFVSPDDYPPRLCAGQ